MGTLLDLVRVLYDPAAVFERVRERPRFLAPFLALALVLIAVALLERPYLEAAMAARLARLGAAGGTTAAAGGTFAVVGAALAPVGFAIVLLVSGAILWLLVTLVGAEASFPVLLSVATYVSVTGVLLQLARLAVLMLRGSGAVASMDDLQPPLGLDLLVPEAGRVATALLGQCNPFTVWGVVLTAIGIHVTQRTSKAAAYGVAAATFVLGCAFAAGAALLRRG
jgi:hypothetical protein